MSNDKVENLLLSEISRPKMEVLQQKSSIFVKQTLPLTAELNFTQVYIFMKSQKFLSCCRIFEVEKNSKVLYNFATFLQNFVSGSERHMSDSFLTKLFWTPVRL